MMRRATCFILLLGLVSLLADVTYEGARSVTGQFLETLGASGAIVGVVAGFAEMVGYVLRVYTGYLSDKTGRPWLFTAIGYTLNLVAVPLLALATTWPMASLLIVMERLGKAIRTPSRDTMLSFAAEQTGRGWGFGLHEAMDRTGAVFGPLVIMAVLSYHFGYPTAFAILGLPAIAALLCLALARRLFPTPAEFEPTRPSRKPSGFSRSFYVAVAALSLVAAGTVDFPLIGYHLSKNSLLSTQAIPLLCAISMATDGLFALIGGRLYDKKGLPILILVVVLTSLSTPFLFLCHGPILYLGGILWGIGIGTQQCLARALIANIVSATQRGAAYGLFNLSYGIFWFIGSAFMGTLYDISPLSLVIVSIAFQLSAVPLLFALKVKE